MGDILFQGLFIILSVLTLNLNYSKLLSCIVGKKQKNTKTTKTKQKKKTRKNIQKTKLSYKIWKKRDEADVRRLTCSDYIVIHKVLSILMYIS